MSLRHDDPLALPENPGRQRAGFWYISDSTQAATLAKVPALLSAIGMVKESLLETWEHRQGELLQIPCREYRLELEAVYQQIQSKDDVKLFTDVVEAIMGSSD